MVPNRHNRDPVPTQAINHPIECLFSRRFPYLRLGAGDDDDALSVDALEVRPLWRRVAKLIRRITPNLPYEVTSGAEMLRVSLQWDAFLVSDETSFPYGKPCF